MAPLTTIPCIFQKHTHQRENLLICYESDRIVEIKSLDTFVEAQRDCDPFQLVDNIYTQVRSSTCSNNISIKIQVKDASGEMVIYQKSFKNKKRKQPEE